MKEIKIVIITGIFLLITACGDTTGDLYPDEGNKPLSDKDAMSDNDETGDITDSFDDNITDEDQKLGGLGDTCASIDECQTPYQCIDAICTDVPDSDEQQDEDSELPDSQIDDDEIIDTSHDDIVDDDGETPDLASDDDSTSICGNSIVEAGEVCDDGNFVNNDYCSNDCQTADGSCGDSIKQSFERCDDGNTDDGDYCSADCTAITGGCGDGIPQTGELCDDGDDNGKYGFCSPFCDGDGLGCGDGVLQGNRELCDDGNTLDGDYCSNDCQAITGMCGDDTLQTNELCDDGNRDDGDYCSNDCQTQNGSCGDGVKQDFEECEEGNIIIEKCTYGETTDCEVCGSLCTLVPGIITFCGDNTTDDENSEACDDGLDNGNYNKCKADCSGYGERCGDGITQTGESCDDGEDNGTYGSCSTLCDGLSRCGDGFIDSAFEVCDDGNNDNLDYCSADCRIITGRCGDSTLQSNEECDDGNVIDDDYCTIQCKDNGNCGDAITQSNEICDDGIYNGSYDKCNDSCSGKESYCGDGYVDSGHETCEIGHSKACYLYSGQYMDGFALCDDTCSDFDNSSCDLFIASALPGTGITSCYNATEIIPCVTPGDGWYGQDGDFAHGDFLASLTKTIEGDLVVNTKIAKIDWQATTDAATYTGSEAQAYCEALSYAGYDDWILPSIEWHNNLLVDYLSAPHILPALASSSESTTYWSQTKHEAKQWIYSLADATTSLVDATTKHKVRCIRKVPKDNFYDDIHIATTNGGGQTYYTESFSHTAWTPQNSALSWKNTLAYCISLSYAGFTDWRLPTQPELLILSNKEHYNPASIFPTAASIPYWSATTSIEALGQAFVVDMLDGSSKTSDKNSTNTFFCVRSTNIN